jgi:hypothetical protein
LVPDLCRGTEGTAANLRTVGRGSVIDHFYEAAMMSYQISEL